MGILSSMYTGLSGLNSTGEALSIYGDNIANANTVGFKTSRPEFSDVIAKSLKGVLGGNQIGRGNRLSAVNPIFSQGQIMQTENPTDLAITGDGFFVLEGPDGRSYTRNGAFHFDKDGKMINADGLKVMGFMADENGKITSKMGEISVDRTVVDAKATDKVELFMNLDVREAKVQFDPKRPNETSAFSTGVTVYDSVGNAHVITVFFNKVDDNKWEWHAMAKGEEIQGGKPGELVEGAKGTLTFDGQGRLLEQKIDKSAFSFTNGAKPNQRVEFSFGKDIKSGGDGLQITQYGTSSQAYKTVQNGFTAGSLAGLSFNDDGILSAVYDNGISLNLAQVALAKFENPEGLFKMGQNRYRESRNSGQATIGGPGQAGRGTVSSKTLEASTTDIANEFINLMTSQRTFQANSKVISSADEMLQDVLNIKHR